jgi:hypothetical protein
MASKRKKAWKEQLKATAVSSLANIAIREAVSAPFAAAGKRFLESAEGLQMATGINKSNHLTSQVNDYDIKVNRTGLGEEEFTRQALRDSVVGKVESVHGDKWRTIAPWMPRQIDELVEKELPRQIAERQALRDKFGGTPRTNAQTIKLMETVNPHAAGPVEWAAKGIGRLIGRRDSIEDERKAAVKTIAHGFGMTDFSETELNELTGLVMAGTSPIDVKWVRTNAEQLLGDKRLLQVEEQAVRLAKVNRDRLGADLDLTEAAADTNSTMDPSIRTMMAVLQAEGGANLNKQGFVSTQALTNRLFQNATGFDVLDGTNDQIEARIDTAFSSEALHELDPVINQKITNAITAKRYPGRPPLDYVELDPSISTEHRNFKQEVDEQVSVFKRNIASKANDLTVVQMGMLFNMKDEKGDSVLPTEFMTDDTAAIYQYRLFEYNIERMFAGGFVEKGVIEQGPKNVVRGFVNSILGIEDRPIQIYTGMIRDPIFGLLGKDENGNPTITGGQLEAIMADSASGDYDWANMYTRSPAKPKPPNGDGDDTDDAPKIDTRPIAARVTAGEDVGETRERAQALVKTAQKQDSYKKLSPSEQYDWVVDLEQKHRDDGSFFPFAPTTNESPFLEVGETEEFTIGSLLTTEKPSTFRMSYGSDGEIEIDQTGRLAAVPGTERNPTYDEIPEGNFKNQIRWISKDYFGITDDLINNHPDVPEELIHGKINPLRGEASAGAVLGSGSPARELKNIQQDLVGMFDIEGIFDYDDIVDLLTQANDAERS